MKHAGRLPAYSDGYGPDSASLVLVALVFGLIATGAMLQAMMTNHGRAARGLLLNVLAGVVAVAIVLAINPPTDLDLVSVVGVAGGLFWLVLAALAFTVGSVIQPPGGPRRKPRF